MNFIREVLTLSFSGMNLLFGIWSTLPDSMSSFSSAKLKTRGSFERRS